MRTSTQLSLAVMLALPLTVGAQIYSWKDASGKVHYSDKPPLEKKVQTREIKTGKISGSELPAPKPAEVGGASKADEPARGEGAGKSTEQAQAEADARQKLCDNARKRLIQLEAQGEQIIVTTNEKGEPVPLVGEKKRAETETARKDVEQWCK